MTIYDIKQEYTNKDKQIIENYFSLAIVVDMGPNLSKRYRIANITTGTIWHQFFENEDYAYNEIKNIGTYTILQEREI